MLPECLKVAKLTKEEHAAIKAVSNGKATEYQQKLCIKVIVDKFAREDDLLFVVDSQDQTVFMNGRAYVGKQIKKAMKQPVKDD